MTSFRMLMVRPYGHKSRKMCELFVVYYNNIEARG